MGNIEDRFFQKNEIKEEKEKIEDISLRKNDILKEKEDIINTEKVFVNKRQKQSTNNSFIFYILIFIIISAIAFWGYYFYKSNNSTEILDNSSNKEDDLNKSENSTDTQKFSNSGESLWELKTEKQIDNNINSQNEDELAEEFLRGHYNDIANDNFWKAYNNYTKNFIDSKIAKNPKTILRSLSSFSYDYNDVSDIKIDDFKNWPKDLNYTYIVFVYYNNWSRRKFLTESQLTKDNNQFKIDWYSWSETK